MTRRLIFIFSVLFLVLSCKSSSHVQPSSTVHESPVIENDISNQKVTSFAEDAHGHIWIGTFRGLNRFNVHEFQQHFCTADEFSLPDNWVRCLYKDSRDRLWISTVNGMALYTEQDNFRRIPMDTHSRNTAQILESSDGRIFINTLVELAVYDEEKGEFRTVLSSVDGTMPAASQCLMSFNDFWLATSSQMLKYDLTTYELVDTVPLDGYFTCFNILTDEMIWMCGPGNVAIYDAYNGRFTDTPAGLKSHSLFNKAQVSYIFRWGATILLNTEKDGMFWYDETNDVLCHQSEKGFPFELPDAKINTMFLDSNDNIWIGTYDQGYHVIYAYEELFNKDSWLKSSLGQKSVVSVDCDSKDNLWISTLKDGLYLSNSRDAIFRKIDLSRLFGTEEAGKVDISHVFVDSRDKVWLTSGAGVARCRFDGYDLVVEKSWQIFLPLALSEDSDGRVWIGSMGENVFYISHDDEVRSMKTIPSHFTFTPYCLPLSDGTVLSASFEHGLAQLDGRTSHSRQIAVPEAQWKDCIRRSVFVPVCMYQTDDGIIWIGTLANGLFRYDLADNSMEHVSGAPCLDITAIEEDEAGYLWVSTQYGLGKYDRNNDEFTNWYADDGIGGNQFYDRASCRLSDGRLVFGGTHGLTVFDPKYITQVRDIPLYFEDLKIHNVLIRPGDGECIEKSLTYNPVIDLDYDQNCFSISFAALDYAEYERVDYQYMLDGFDGHWIEAHNNREAYYSNIPGGRYDFKVRVTSRDKSVVIAENSIKVRVQPPFWIRWWSFLVYILISAVIFQLLAKGRRIVMEEKQAKLKAQQEKEQEKKVNQMNMSFFANISHEFRTPLTMIAGPVAQLASAKEMTHDNKRLLEIVQRNISRMLRLVNQLLDFNKLENDTLKLKVREMDVISQLNGLVDLFSVTAKEKGVIFNTFGLEESFKVWIDDDKIDKMCFNLLSNAMKFTSSGGKVEFILDVITREDALSLFKLKEGDTDSRWLKIQVKDSGPGLPEDQLEKIFERYYQLENQVRGSYNWGTGIGLYFARTLATMHHGYLKAGNRTTGRGAVFTLVLPVSESSYAEHEKYDLEGAGQLKPVKIDRIRYSETKNDSANDSSDRKVVLVVDDDVDVVHYLKEILSSEYKVLTCFDADTAYALMKEKAPDVVISDVVMPGKSGCDLCQQIKENIQLSHIPVILLTAKATVEDQVLGLDSGADAYVTKPFEPQYVLALISSQLKNREKIRDILSEATAVEHIDEDVLSPQDNSFMNELYRLMENELSNSELDVARMTEMMRISRTKFYYKVKGLTGENPSVFFKRYKLNRAAQLMKERKYNISEIADMTGFSTLSHFSTSFKKQFGCSPSEYQKREQDVL